MTLTYPEQAFKVTALLKLNISTVSYGQSYYRTVIGNHTQSIEQYHIDDID